MIKANSKFHSLEQSIEDIWGEVENPILELWMYMGTFIEGIEWESFYWKTPVSVLREMPKMIARRMEKGWSGNKEMIAYKALRRSKDPKAFE